MEPNPERNQNPSEQPVEIKRLNRELLSKVRLLSDPQRASIVERLLHQPNLAAARLQKLETIPPSSFFKFAEELIDADVITRSGTKADNHYRVTEIGSVIFGSLIDLESKLENAVIESTLERLSRIRNLNADQLDEIRKILHSPSKPESK